MTKVEKNYHAWLDISLGKVVTQPMQRILINDFVKKIGGKIVFELGEDVEFKSFMREITYNRKRIRTSKRYWETKK